MSGDKRSKAGKVLVVDDDPFTRKAIVKMLETMGFGKAREAADGSSALSMTLEDPPYLILCDVHMKPMDGLSFALALRNMRGLGDVDDIKLIFVSGDSRKDVIDLAGTLRGADFIIKPVTAEKLRRAIDKLIEF